MIITHELRRGLRFDEIIRETNGRDGSWPRSTNIVYLLREQKRIGFKNIKIARDKTKLNENFKLNLESILI